MWGLVAKAAGQGLKWMFTSRTGQLLTATGAGAAAEAVMSSPKKKSSADKDEDTGSLGGWAARKIFGDIDWKQGMGMAVVGMAVAGLGRSLLGDNIVSSVAAVALGVAVAFGLSHQIKGVTNGFSSFFNGHSGATKRDALSASQMPVPAPQALTPG